MKLGLMLFCTDYAIRPDDFARAAEERGFESVWYPEHSHIPASRRTPYPAGGDLPKDYWHTNDLFISLAMAAAVTTRIRIASGICLVIQRDPIHLAKEVATLDRLSNGRFLFGIGGGWNAEEMENHGTPFAERWKILREKIDAMKQIWAHENAEYHGRYVDFDPIWQYPKPLTQPHPPILLGTATALGRQKVVDYCDGWIPIDLLIDDLPAAIADLHARAKKAGRDPRGIPISIFWGKAEEAELAKYQELGVERVIFGVPSVSKDEVLPILDQYAKLVPKFA